MCEEDRRQGQMSAAPLPFTPATPSQSPLPTYHPRFRSQCPSPARSSASSSEHQTIARKHIVQLDVRRLRQVDVDADPPRADLSRPAPDAANGQILQAGHEIAQRGGGAVAHGQPGAHRPIDGSQALAGPLEAHARVELHRRRRLRHLQPHAARDAQLRACAYPPVAAACQRERPRLSPTAGEQAAVIAYGASRVAHGLEERDGAVVVR